MPWLLVITAGFFEVAFATLLKLSNSFTRIWPTIGFAICAILSFGLLSSALRYLPIGTAYAVWTGIGAAGTVVVGILFLRESSDLVRLLSITLIIVGVVGLRFSSPA